MILHFESKRLIVITINNSNICKKSDKKGSCKKKCVYIIALYVVDQIGDLINISSTSKYNEYQLYMLSI